MSSHRILVVDDEPFNVEYLDQELTDRGYLVATAFNGQQALSAVESDPPDLILLDVLMPGIDGIEVCRRLKADDRTRLIPIIIMTALTDPENRIRGVEAGADDFLSKPVDDRELFARMRNALRLKSAIDERADELHTAAERIAQLGKHDEEVAVVAISAADDDPRRFVEAAAERGGVAGRAASSPAAIFRGDGPAASASSAVEFALEFASDVTGGAVGCGISVGSALIGAGRAEVGAGHEWVIDIEGPAAGEAGLAVGSAAPGQVLVTPSVIEHLGTSFGATRVGEAGSIPLYEATAVPATGRNGTYELDFPSEFSALLPVLRREWGITDLYATKSLSGKSGARVLVVDISMTDFSGQAILKLEEVDGPEADEAVEAERHRRALERGGPYASDRLPRLLKHLNRDGITATLSTIAAGGLEYCQAWFRTPYELQLAAAERISYDTLQSWNADYSLEPGLLAPSSVLERWLTHRLDPVEGRLDAVLLDLFGVDPGTPSIFLDGILYPNPVAFARRAADHTAEPAIRAVVGQMHGDMHGYNVLMSQRRPDVPDYFLIDLAYYQEENFLFFDHAYFELTYLMRAREDAGPARWIELLNGVFDGRAVNADDIGITRVVDAIRSGQRRWIREHEEHRESYMSTQMILGQIAAGLNFANKRVERDVKVQAFLYASIALRELIELHALDWPRTGEVTELALG